MTPASRLRRALIAALLLSPALRAEAARDPYASLKPLVGSWLVEKDCVTDKESFLAVFTRRPRSMHFEFFDPRRPEESIGAGDIVSAGVPDHYRLSVRLPGNPVLKALRLDALPGSLVVSDDADDPDSPGKDYLTASAEASLLKSQTIVKLRDRKRKASFIFKDETPLGKDQCRGTGVKRKSAR
jgi:hypothetical protein